VQKTLRELISLKEISLEQYNVVFFFLASITNRDSRSRTEHEMYIEFVFNEHICVFSDNSDTKTSYPRKIYVGTEKYLVYIYFVILKKNGY
jgi:hypothetical protein